jgi:hypothetical protein
MLDKDIDHSNGMFNCKVKKSYTPKSAVQSAPFLFYVAINAQDW